MASVIEEDFESWLSFKLKALNTDEGVFGSYITGILDGEETIEEKNEALEGILVEITPDDITKHCEEIISKYENYKTNKILEKTNSNKSSINLDDRLAQLLEPTKQDLIVQKEYTDEEKKIREVILSQYAQTSDHEDDYEDDVQSPAVSGLGGGGGESSGNNIFKNTNAALVAQAEKEKREKAKVDSQMKKEKDKADREKQKQLQAEKKEKRKTQKGERRR